MIKLSHSTVVSKEYACYPNGEMIAKGTVCLFNNKTPNKYDPVKVGEISVRNSNGVAFFERKETLSVETMRAIASALTEIADEAEKATEQMIKLAK